VQTVISQQFSHPLLDGKHSSLKIARLSRAKRLGSWLYIGVFFIVAVGIPYFAIITSSLTKLRGIGLRWDNLTLGNYTELLTWGSEGMQALMNSFSLAFLTATISVILGTYLAIVIKKSSSRLERLLDFLSLLPNTIPSIVFVVGLILLWNAPGMPIPLYNTYGMVVLTYVILFLPYTVQYVKVNLTKLAASLFEAGQVCGGSPPFVLGKIVLPLLVPGMLAGWMITFTVSFRELVASLMILPPSMETSATYIFSQFEQGRISLGLDMAVKSVGLTTLMLLLVNRLTPGNKWHG